MARDASGITGGSVSKVKEEAESNRTDKTLAVDARSLFDAKCTCYARAALPALFRPNFQLPKSQISEPLIRSTVNVVQLFAPLECRANSSEKNELQFRNSGVAVDLKCARVNRSIRQRRPLAAAGTSTFTFCAGRRLAHTKYDDTFPCSSRMITSSDRIVALHSPFHWPLTFNYFKFF